MWFSWLLFVLLWRKIKPMMCLAHIRVCGTEIRYSAVFQASLNHFKRLPAKNTSASFHFKCIRFSSRFGLWRFLADSWGEGANGFGDVDGTGVSRALLQFCLRMVFFLFVKAIVHLMPSCSYLKPLSVQFSREQYSHFVTVNHILLLQIKKKLWLIFSFFFFSPLETWISIPLQGACYSSRPSYQPFSSQRGHTWVHSWLCSCLNYFFAVFAVLKTSVVALPACNSTLYCQRGHTALQIS